MTPCIAVLSVLEMHDDLSRLVLLSSSDSLPVHDYLATRRLGISAARDKIQARDGRISHVCHLKFHQLDRSSADFLVAALLLRLASATRHLQDDCRLREQNSMGSSTAQSDRLTENASLNCNANRYRFIWIDVSVWLLSAKEIFEH